MKTYYYALPLVLLSTSALAASPEEGCTREWEIKNNRPCITITATRNAQPIDKVGSSVTVLTREDFKRNPTATVADTLKQVPGITLSRNGGVGATTQIRLRGAEPGQVRVLIDGISVNDASMSDNSFDFSTLLLDDIERIEVLRGPQSSLYGSDAMGGVINIITRKGKNRGFTAFAETGSYRTFHEGLGYGGGDDNFYYGGSFQHFRNAGFSRITAGTEEDGSRIADFKGNFGGKLMENFSVDFSGGYSDSSLEFDPSPTTDGPAFQDKKQAYGAGQAVLSLFDGVMENTFKLGANSTKRDFDEPLATSTRFSTFDGTRIQAGYQADVKTRPQDVATLGVEWQRDKSDTTATNTTNVTTQLVDRSVDNTAFYGQYMLGLTDDWTLTAGGRHDDHDQFGTFNTYRFTTAYNLPDTDTTLRASYGTGFKAPTLFQLFHPTFGTSSLRPEESTGYDFGIEQRFFDDRVNATVTAFHNDFENLIIFDTGTSSYRNVKKANAEGIETGLTFRASPDLLLSGNYVYMLSEDESNNRALQRRPRHSMTLSADYDVSEKGRIGASWRFVSRQWDTTSGTREVKPYGTVDLTGSYDINPNFTLYSRLENLFDRDYGEVARYNAAGMSAYVGVKANY